MLEDQCLGAFYALQWRLLLDPYDNRPPKTMGDTDVRLQTNL